MDDFIDDVITPPIEIEVTLTKEFQPWHKPRKQWCRYNQWYKGLTNVIDKTGPDNIESFNYIGLPGDDLLDLRLFAHGCKAKKVPFKYLGFNSIGNNGSRSTELSLSQSELSKTKSIHPASQIIREPLQQLADIHSSAYNEAKRFGGFHMINFDLCDSIANNSGLVQHNSYFEAIKNLLILQLQYMRGPWLLFITTRACKNSVNEEIMQKLLLAIKSNNDLHTSFKEELENTLCISKDEIDDAISDFKNIDEDFFLTFFTLGLSKWILLLNKDHLKSWTINMTTTCKYMTGFHDNTTPDMVSLGFYFDYKAPVLEDNTGLTINSITVEDDIELDLAINMINEVFNIFDLDDKLKNDTTEMTLCIENSAALLENARYNKDDYLEWIKNGYK